MNENIVIEPFSLNILEVISNSLEKDFDDFWNYNILKKEIENPGTFYIVCKQGSEVIGFAGISIILDTAELNNIVVKKSNRGHGISSILLEELIKIAKKKGCKKINLEVAATNTIAISLYKKFGFEQVGLRPKYYNGVDALLYSLEQR